MLVRCTELHTAVVDPGSHGRGGWNALPCLTWSSEYSASSEESLQGLSQTAQVLQRNIQHSECAQNRIRSSSISHFPPQNSD